jgi:tetratricopeptide (TPR) repeat protein
MKTIQISVFLACMSALSGADTGGTSGSQPEEWKSRCSEAQRLFHAGEWSRAEGAYLQALQLARTMPDNASATLTSLNELSLFYMSTQRFDKATPTLNESLALQTKALGGNDPGLVRSLNLLGISYRELHRYDDARVAHHRALTILENALPERSFDLGFTWSELGSVEDVQCHFTKARNYFSRALDYLDRVPNSSSDLARVRTWNSLASEYVLLGQFEKAKPLLANSLKIVDTPQYAQTELFVQTLDQAAMFQLAQRKLTDAEKIWNRAISITSPESRPHRVSVLMHLAELQCYLKEHEQAKDLLRQAEQLYDQIYQTQGNLYSMILANRGLVAIASGDTEGATALLDRALKISRACGDRDLIAYSEILHYRAMAAEAQHDLITAKTMLSESSQIRRDVFGDSPVTAHGLLAYARVLKKLKLKSEAREYEQTARTMLDRLPSNRSTSDTVDVKALRQNR